MQTSEVVPGNVSRRRFQQILLVDDDPSVRQGRTAVDRAIPTTPVLADAGYGTDTHSAGQHRNSRSGRLAKHPGSLSVIMAVASA